MSVTFNVSNATYRIARFGAMDERTVASGLTDVQAQLRRANLALDETNPAVEYHVEPEQFVNVSNANARELLRFVGLPSADDPQPFGKISAAELRVLCRRALIRDVAAPPTPERPASVTKGARGATVIDCGRREGYLEDRTKALLALAEYAGAGMVSWS